MATTKLQSQLLTHHYTSVIWDVDNISIASGAETSVGCNIEITGYYPIGVVGIDIGNATNNGAYWGSCICRTWHCDDTTANVRLRNIHASATCKIHLWVVVLYRKLLPGEY